MPSWSLDPVFITGTAGRLFALHVRPRAAVDEAVLYLPPFAEEMNRSRRMAGLLGRRLAERGVGFMILDPFGTGDSDGEFREARWTTWCDDADVALQWLKGRGYRRLSVLGLRLGACLALRAAPRAGPDLGRIVLWQPVLRGETFVNQFLRIRVAAGMTTDGGGQKESIKELRAKLATGEVIEVAGYALDPALIEELDGLSLASLAQQLGPVTQPLAWLEVSRSPERALTPASRKAVEDLRNSNTPVVASTVPGEPFWSIEEPAYVPDLWRATAALWDEAAP